MTLGEILNVGKEAVTRWFNSRAFELGAALAYYAVFSIAPILVISIAVAGALFGEDAAQGRIVAQLDQTLGPKVAPAIEGMIYKAHTGSSWLAATISIAVLLFGAVSLFSQLQRSLNDIWGVQPRPDRGIWDVVKERGLPFLLVGFMALLLLASLVISSILSAMIEVVSRLQLPGDYVMWQLINWLVSLALLSVLFAVIFRLLPDARIAWEDVWIGGIITAVLFSVGSYGIGLYVSRQSVTSPYGAAGSLVIVLLWVYYSSQTVLLGAEFTFVLAKHRGKIPEPTPNATLVAKPA